MVSPDCGGWLLNVAVCIAVSPDCGGWLLNVAVCIAVSPDCGGWFVLRFLLIVEAGLYCGFS